MCLCMWKLEDNFWESVTIVCLFGGKVSLSILYNIPQTTWELLALSLLSTSPQACWNYRFASYVGSGART